MSLAARCPWCETVFRLTEGQISAKGGMARCGVCNHTFNALDALLSDSAVAALERGAQAREANQEATTARANEQAASKPPESIPIPISIRKILGGANTPSPAPAPSSPAPSPTSAPFSAPSTAFSAPAPEAAAPSAFTAPVAPSVKEEPRPSVAAEEAPAAMEAMAATLPEAHHEPVSATTPPAAVPAEAAHEVHHAAQASAQPAEQPEQPEQPAQSEQSEQPEQPSESMSSAPDASIEPAPSEVQQPAPEPVIASDYKVEMPNYDAERAAALAEAERLQREQQERHQRKLRRDAEEAAAARAAIEKELDAVQSALSPTSDTEQDEHEAAPEAAAPSATLQSLRLQHAAVQAASKSDLLREDERLGPNTFQPSFLLATKSPARFHRTRRFFGSLLILVLFVGLLAQATYWWRSDVAMRVPQTRPYLVRACQRFHCEVNPPAQIDQLSIESSELVAAPGAAGALGFTALVRNHSSNALAYPAIEITLTDARDQAILRRVFLPDNYLGDPLGTRRLLGIPGNSEYTLKLTFSTSGVATSGYRAGIFYP